MKSGLKGSVVSLLPSVCLNVSTYAAMKSGLKVRLAISSSVDFIVSTYAAMKSGLKAY